MNNETVKKTMFIDGRECEFADERNVLEVIRKAGYDVPTLCYRSDLSIHGGCRMCVVEVEGRGLMASCTLPPDGDSGAVIRPGCVIPAG